MWNSRGPVQRCRKPAVTVVSGSSGRVPVKTEFSWIAVVDFARESFKKIQLLANNKRVILVSKSNPALRSDGYVEIALYLTDRDDFIPPASQPDKPDGLRFRDME